MMFNLALIFLAIVFFFILGKGADLLVSNLKIIIDKTKIHPVLLGAILGFLTTIPEFMVGLNAIYQEVPAIFLGNIWGGIIVIFGFILGMSIILQREIKTDGHILVVLPTFIFIIFSLFLGLKGVFYYYDGLLLVACYLILIYLDYLSGSHYQDHQLNEKTLLEKQTNNFWQKIVKGWLFWKEQLRHEILWAFIGLFLVSISSYVILEIANIALNIFPVPPFLVGLLIFSLGTNLPEIIVMLRSIKNKSSDLSFGHLVGSAASNILVLSLITFIKPITLSLSWRYYFLLILVVVMFSVVSIFYVTGKKFQRWEGIVLVLLYLIFIFYEFFK